MADGKLEIRLRKVRKRKRRKKPPPIRVPATVQASYYADLVRYLRHAEHLVDRDVPDAIRGLGTVNDSMRADTSPDDFSRLIRQLRLELARIVDRRTLRTVAKGAAASVLSSNRRLTKQQFRAILGIDLLTDDPPLRDLIQIFTSENVSLIKTISDRYFDDIESEVLTNWSVGKRPSELLPILRERYGVSLNVAKRIARDQTNKLNGQLVEARQTDLGIRKYRWRNAGDERVRGNPSGRYPHASPSHWEREGKVYSWDEPPEGGHPGEAIQCRCWAEPIVPGVND